METHLIVSNDELLSWMPRIMGADVVALDTETTGLDWQSDIIVGLSFSLDGNTGYYVPFAHRTGPQCSYLVVKYVMELVLRNPDLIKVFHNSKFDIHMMWSVFGIRTIHPYHDTMFMAFLDDNTAPKGLKDLSAKFFGTELVEAEAHMNAIKSSFRLKHMSLLTPAEMEVYGALDAVMTFKLYERYTRLGVAPIYGTEIALVDSIIDMERVGVRIDTDFLGAAGNSMKERLPIVEAELNEIVGRTLNPRSPAQVGAFLYGDLGLVPRKYTKTGAPSADEASLLSFPQHPAIDRILESRTLSKTISTYINGISDRLDVNDRLHCRFNQAGTDTGRFSSSKPNLQNIPREGRVPVSIRGAFIPSDGRFLAFIDYKQVEFYMFAHYANDPAMLALVQDGHDFHKATATAVFNKRLEDIIWEERKFAKQVNFGYIYGIGARALAEKLGTSIAVAKAFLRRYDLQFPGVKTYVNQCKDDYAMMGYTENIFGRRRKIPFDKAYRAVNTLCQGCIQWDQKIFTKDRGIRTLRESLGQQTLWDGKKWIDVRIIEVGWKEAWKITFTDHSELICSKDHPFLTLNVKKALIWKRTSELQGFNETSSPSRILYGSAPGFELDESSWKKGIALGRLASDGMLTSRLPRWIVAEHELEIWDELWECIEELGWRGVGSDMSWKMIRRKPPRKPLYHIKSGSFEDTWRLRNQGLKRTIPDFIWHDPSILLGYLRGFFDGDGGVGSTVRLAFGYGKLKWALAIQVALRMFGIQSAVHGSPKGTRLHVRKKHVRVFERLIGFMNPKKQQLLSKISETSRQPTQTCRVQSIENLHRRLQMADVVDCPDQHYALEGFITHNTAADIVKRAMVDLRPLLRTSATDMILTIHDELAFDIPFEEVAIVPEITKIMQNYRMRVPIIAETDWSPISWGDKRPWKGIEEVQRERSVSRQDRGSGRSSSSDLAERDRPADRLLRDLRAGSQG